MTQMFEIEFIGGPYDGHKELLGSACPAEELAWIVCEDVFRLLAGKDRRTHGRITSVAIYELEVLDGMFRYRFLHAISYKELADSVRETCIQMTNGGRK
jgi:hypothetical protein